MHCEGHFAESTSWVMTSILTQLVIGLSADQQMNTDWFNQNKPGQPPLNGSGNFVEQIFVENEW